jgi:hypothetical protein
MDKAIARQLTFIEAAGDAEKFDQVAKKACLDRLVDEVNQAQGALAPYAAMGPRLPAELRPKLRELQDACDKADREMEDARKDFEAGRVELHRLGAVARDEAITARAALARVQITIATGIGKEARALILPDQALYKKRPERAPDALFPLWREAMQINGIVQRLANDPVAVLAALERGAGDTFEILSAKCEDSREAGADPMQRRTPNTDGLLSMTF